MCLVKEYHAKTALSDATSDRERKAVFEQTTVEIKRLSVLFSLKFKLVE